MQIECQYCHKKLNAPDNKVEYGRPLSFVCPGCSQKNTFTPNRRQSVELAPPPLAAPEPFAAQTPPPASVPPPAPVPPREAIIVGSAPTEFTSIQLDEIAEGIKSALVAYDNEEVQAALFTKLTNIGYRPVMALNVRDAVKQLKFGRFRLMLIQEDYYGATLSSNQLIRAVNSLELSIRHEMFIAVIGPNFTSLDDLTAFSLSLDTVINTADLDDIERILISGMGHVQKFYATYNEMLLQRGLD
ncbi:MAG: hypothetical protein LBT86_10325 [Deltaproteobacteria bacterium]|jgi:hypothetical protein|nr:hypothetical protein [Deltaproteobacteria bacterium]